MRALVFGDTHEGKYRWSAVEEEARAVWDWAIQKVKEYECQLVIYLGDRFKSRDPDGITRDRSDEGVIRLAQHVQELIVICGNHDFYYKWGSIENNYGVLKYWPGIVVVDNQLVKEIDGVRCEFIAYGQKPSGEGGWLFMHDEVEGITKWAKGLKWQDLDSYEKVFSGHIHARLELNKLVYVGCPFQQSFADGLKVGGVVIDFSTKQWQWVDGYGIKFLVGLPSGVDNLQGCVVQVESEEQKEQALAMGALDVIVIRSTGDKLQQPQSVEGVVSPKGIDWDKWLRRYVELKGYDLNSQQGIKLVQVGKLFLDLALSGGGSKV